MPDVELSSLGSVIKTAYETQADTNAFTDAEQTKLAGITAGAEANVDTNLGVTADGVQLLVTSSTGTSTSLPAATGTTWGVMSDEIFDAVVLNTAKVTNVTTNLAYTTAASDGTVTSSDGTDATIPAATISLAGLLTGTDKTKLDGIATGAQVNVATNLAYTTAASEGTVTSSDGTDATIPAATISLAGLLTGADKTKLDGIAPGAGAPVNTNLGYTTAASEGTVTSSDGTDATIPAATQALAGLLTSTDKTKLDIAVILTGTPADNQIGVWTNANTQEGDANLTWDGTTLTVTGDVTSTGRVIGTNSRTTDLVFLTVNGGTGVANPVDPEGSNDPFDTVANAFKYAEETYSGINALELNILAGTYNTGATLVIPSNVSQLNLYGAGIGTTILNFTQLSGSNVQFVYFFQMTINTTTTFVSFIGNLQLETVTWNTAGPIIFGGITDTFWDFPGSAITNSTIVATSASASAFDLITCTGHLTLTGTVAISLTNSNTSNGTNGGSVLVVDTGSLELAASATINIQDEAANVATEGDITIANGAKYIEGTSVTITNGNFITNDTTGVIVGQLRPAITSLATSRALAITDATDIIEVDASAGAVEVTIPLNATVPFPIGTAIVFTLVDVTNPTTIVGDTGVTVNGVVTGSGDFTGAQWDVIEIYKRGTDEWVVTPISNQTATEIKTAYESNADTNAFTDAEQTKLGSAVILTGTPVNNQLGVWTNANTQEGDANLTWDGTTLTATGNVSSTGTTTITTNQVASGATPAPVFKIETTADGALYGQGNVFEASREMSGGATESYLMGWGMTSPASGLQGGLELREYYTADLTGVYDVCVFDPLGNWIREFNGVVQSRVAMSASGFVINVDPTNAFGNSDFTFMADGVVQFEISPVGNVTLAGTVDGRDIATDGAKLDTAVIITGTPVNNQLGVWTNANTQEGDANLTWDASTLAVTGAITATGRVIGSNTASTDYVYIFVNSATGVANPVDPEGASDPFDTIANALTYAQTTYSAINRLELEVAAGTYTHVGDLEPPSTTTNFTVYGAGIGTTILNFDRCNSSNNQFIQFYNMTVNTGTTGLAALGNTNAGTFYLDTVTWNTTGRFFFGGSPDVNWGVQGSVIQNSTITATWDIALSRPLIACTGNLQFIGTNAISVTNSVSTNGTGGNNIIYMDSGILSTANNATINIQDETAGSPVAGTMNLAYGALYSEGTGVTITNGTFVKTDASGVVQGDIKTVYEANADTNAFTDAEQTKLGSAVILTGTPVNNQLGVWTNANTQEGDANLTWDGSLLTVTGAVTATSTLTTTVQTVMGNGGNNNTQGRADNAAIKIANLDPSINFTDTAASADNFQISVADSVMKIWQISDGQADTIPGTEIARFANGTASATAQTVITREKGDIRYGLTSIFRQVGDETTALTTGVAKLTFRMPYAMTVTEVRASVTTAPTDATISIGINEGGVSILSTDLTIDSTELTSTTAATAAVISDADLADDAEITIDIDQVGSTVAGAGLKITLIGTQVY